jgi:uncharacterized membrane protein
MNPVAKALVRSAVGITVTAGMAYVCDPDSGQRRRQALGERCASTAKRIGDDARITRHDLTQRLNAVSSRAKAAFARNKSSDISLSKRVRVAIWRAVPHPGTIKVVAHDGHVILYGDVFPREHEHVVQVVRSVERVREISDHLTETTSTPEETGALATVRKATMSLRQFPLFQETWSPPRRVFSGVAAGVMLAWAATHRNPLGALSGIAGAALFLRSGTNVPFKRMVRARRGEIEVHKVIEVAAPVDYVFGRLASYDNFPAFMRSARAVRQLDDGLSHWSMAGPGGVIHEWASQTTLNRPREVFAWRTVGSSAIEHTGIIRFAPLGSDRTRLDVLLTYSASGKTHGDVLAELLGADPKREVEADLARMRIFLETGALARGRTQERSGMEPSSARTSLSGEGQVDAGQSAA